MEMSEPTVRENHAKHRFELGIAGGGDKVAASYFGMKGDALVFTHTEVPEEFEGQGIASLLARGIFENLRDTGRKAILYCPFLIAYFKRHPEYADVVLPRPEERT